MPLEESFQAFERGMALKKRLEKLLEEGDRRIRVLTETARSRWRGKRHDHAQGVRRPRGDAA